MKESRLDSFCKIQNDKKREDKNTLSLYFILCYNICMNKLKIYLKPFLNFKFLLSFGIAWLITNGWSYICLALSIKFNIGWLKVVSTTYIAFLYMPFTVEKIITIPLAIFLQERLFPRDVKLHAELLKMHEQARNDFKNVFKKTIVRNELKKMLE